MRRTVRKLLWLISGVALLLIGLGVLAAANDCRARLFSGWYQMASGVVACLGVAGGAKLIFFGISGFFRAPGEAASRREVLHAAVVLCIFTVVALLLTYSGAAAMR